LKNFTKLSQLPNYSGKVKLKIKREDYKLADEAVAKLNKDIIENRKSLSPTHTPVSRLLNDSESETKDLEG
jgi:hypothetical protein